MDRAIVVGGGILGSMHALLLRRAGVEVVQLEAGPAAAGASVRNFGLVWVSGRRTGAELAAAQRARQLWEEIGGAIPGVGFRADGSLTVAVEAVEAKIMATYAAGPEAAARDTTFVPADEVTHINPAIRGETQGALWCQADAIVEPRLAVGAIRDHLAARPGFRFEAGRRVVEAGTGFVVDHLGERWEADLVIVATGAWFDGVFGDRLVSAPVRKVRLQMMQTEPYGPRLTTSVADADSMRYYPAYPTSLVEGLPPQSALAARHHLQLLLVQRANGSLTIGDTHAYDEPFEFDLDEAPYAELLQRAERILGAPVPPVTRRWEGVYCQCTDDHLWYREQVEPDVWLVTAPGGRGMTCSPAIAEETLAGMAL